MRFIVCKIIVIFPLLFCTALRSDAGQVTQSDMYPLEHTNWVETATLYKFDGTLGNLISVALTMNGEILANAGYENLAGVHNDVTLNAGANLTATFTSNPLLSQYGFDLTITPSNIGTFSNIPAFDSVNNFGGTSGQLFTGLTGSASDTLSTTIGNTFHPVIQALIFAEFTDQDGMAGGLDTIEMEIQASGASIATDVHGNVASLFQTKSAGDYTLTYVYETDGMIGAVPEPMAISLIALAFSGLLMTRVRNDRVRR